MEEKYYIYNDEINSDHADILQVITSAGDIFKDGNDLSLRKFLHDSRHGFLRYAENHIKKEEKLFTLYSMPKTFIELHRKDHGRLTLMLVDLFENINELGRYEIIERTDELQGELAKHVLGIDTEMNNYIKD